tara:strand:+ start:498 stop:614 length:117 start_codon:yes stop_codon:yes gene_type:complete
MELKEINKHLEKESISPELKKALEVRKYVLENNKTIKK